jgi:hypothetical protein
VAEGDGRSGDVIRTPDQRVRVFVSSTLEELAAALRHAGDDPRVRASSRPPKQDWPAGWCSARARFAAGLPLLRGGGDMWDLALPLLNSGLEEAQAASPAAAVLLTEALRTWQQLRLRAGVAFALAGLGEVAADGGQPDRAGQLLGAAQALLPATRNPSLRVTVPYELPARLAAARARGDPAAFDRGLAEGQDRTIDQAVAAGLADADRR